MTGKKHLKNWEQQWLEGNISGQEAAEHADDSQFESLEKFVAATKNIKVPEKRTKDEAWQLLEDKLSENHSPKVIAMSRRNWLIGIAASFILAIGAFFILKDLTNQTSIDTALAEVKSIELPDGSKVHLNAESTVSYREKGWEESRAIKLEGEAFFEVKRGSSFKVITANGEVEVLGTSFNVRSRGDWMQVACKTGKVRVSSSSSDSEQLITPGLAVSIENGRVTKPVETRLDIIDSWRSGEYYFESLPLQQILNEVKRLYQVEIDHDFSQSELKSPITTTFSSLKDAVQTIAVQKGRKHTLNEAETQISFIVD